MTNQIILTADMNTAYVTKKFMRNALVYGTDEYRLLKEFKSENPNVVVKERTIAKNPDKASYKNLTYKNMVTYMETLPNSYELLNEFEVVKQRSAIASNKYRYILNWFKATCFANDLEFIEFRKQISLETELIETILN